MRVSLNQRQTVEHTVIIRALADKTIVAREPGFIKLPLPLPSVPVLTPLLSPIVGGSNSGNKNGNTGTTTTAAASSSPTSGSTTGNSGGSTGGSSSGDTGSGSSSGSSSGSGSSGDTSGGSSSSTTSPSGGDSSSSGTSSSSGGTASSGDSSSTSPGSSPGSTTSGNTSSGNTGDGTASAGGSQTSSVTGGGTVLTSNGTVADGGSGSSSSTGGTENGGTSSSLDSAGNVIPGGVANAGKTPSGGNGTTGSQGTHSTGANGLPGTTTGAGGGSSGVGGISNGGGDDNQSGGKHGLSGGATAGIIICLLALLIACIIFFVRRRIRSRRNEQANRWWFSRKRVSQTYGDRNSQEILPTGAQTARSSFATTVDHSFHSNPPSSRGSGFIIPPLPPMAEVGRANGAAPAMVIDTSYFTNSNGANDNRFSIGSGTSDNHSQYLLVNRDSLNTDLGTPMSVRPFSPSESFAFPKPPDPTNSRPSSSATLAMLSPAKAFHPTTVPPTPGLPTVNIDNNPINSVIDPFLDSNPFDDPTVNSANGPTGEFAEVEFICRPFHPTLPDELSVRPQDPVRVLQAFDDGWALVEKVRLDDPKGKEKGKEGNDGERGLIPIDCLRAPGQDLPEFFAAKRVSSYGGSVAGSGLGFQAI